MKIAAFLFVAFAPLIALYIFVKQADVSRRAEDRTAPVQSPISVSAPPIIVNPDQTALDKIRREAAPEKWPFLVSSLCREFLRDFPTSPHREEVERILRRSQELEPVVEAASRQRDIQFENEAQSQIPASSRAEVRFSSLSNGYDWNRATDSYKMEYCELMAKANQRLAPGISGAVIYDSLSEFYSSGSDGLLKTRIVRMIGLTVSAYVHRR